MALQVEVGTELKEQSCYLNFTFKASIVQKCHPKALFGVLRKFRIWVQT